MLCCCHGRKDLTVPKGDDNASYLHWLHRPERRVRGTRRTIGRHLPQPQSVRWRVRVGVRVGRNSRATHQPAGWGTHESRQHTAREVASQQASPVRFGGPEHRPSRPTTVHDFNIYISYITVRLVCGCACEHSCANSYGLIRFTRLVRFLGLC